MANVTNTNLWINRARIYKGFFQIIVGQNCYKYFQPVEMSETISASLSKHYDTEGGKKLESVGNDSVFRIKVTDTADLYDTRAEPNQTHTLSYFIDKIIDNEIPQIEFEGVLVTEAQSDEYIRRRFRGGVISTEHQRNTDTGVYETTLVIEITEKTIVQRTNQ